MKIHFRTVLVSSAALAITGGAAFAYINATSVSGGGTATTSSVATSLSLYPDVSQQPYSVIPSGVVGILADNTSTVPLRVPATTTVTVSAPSCPPGSFTAVYTPPANDVPVGLAGDGGSVAITFNDLPVDQSACNGGTLTFSFTNVPS